MTKLDANDSRCLLKSQSLFVVIHSHFYINQLFWESGLLDMGPWRKVMRKLAPGLSAVCAATKDCHDSLKNNSAGRYFLRKHQQHTVQEIYHMLGGIYFKWAFRMSF